MLYVVNTCDTSASILACNVHHPGFQYQAALGVQACKPIYLLLLYALTDTEFVFGASTAIASY